MLYHKEIIGISDSERRERENLINDHMKKGNVVYCETAILKDVIITEAECSTKPFYYALSNGIRRVDKVVNTLIFYIHPIGTFCYITENSIEIKKIIEGIKNKKHFTIKYKKLSREVIEIISETNT